MLSFWYALYPATLLLARTRNHPRNHPILIAAIIFLTRLIIVLLTAQLQIHRANLYRINKKKHLTGKRLRSHTFENRSRSSPVIFVASNKSLRPHYTLTFSRNAVATPSQPNPICARLVYCVSTPHINSAKRVRKSCNNNVGTSVGTSSRSSGLVWWLVSERKCCDFFCGRLGVPPNLSR